MIGQTFVKIIDKGYKLTREIYILRDTQNQKCELLRNGNWVEIDSYSTDEKPTLELLPEELQMLADELNKNGFKPQKGFLEGKLEATDKHLEDMRKLVFKDLT